MRRRSRPIPIPTGATASSIAASRRRHSTSAWSKAGIYPCPQQVFIYDFGDAYVTVLGEERALPSYPIRTWIDLGLKPATGSDAPVCDPNPFPNFYSDADAQDLARAR